MAANPRLTNKTVAPFFNPLNLMMWTGLSSTGRLALPSGLVHGLGQKEIGRRRAAG